MTEREMQAHAQRIIEEHVAYAEYSIVYEDEELEDATEEELKHIHDLITHASITAQF